MKRTIRTLAAAAMAGAIAISVTPAADAQTDPIEILTAQAIARYGENLPKVIEDGQGNRYELVNGNYIKTELPAAPGEKVEVPTFEVGPDGSVSFNAGVNVEADPAPVASLRDLAGAAEIEVEGDQAANVETVINGVADTREVVAGQVAEAKCDQEIWYLTKDGKAYVADQKLVDAAELPADAKTRTPESAQQDCVFVEAPAVEADTAEAEAQLSPGAIAGIAAAAIGLPIVIAGVTYFLNQDGETLVGSSDRVNQEPTPEEKAKSDQLRAEHADEIAAQQVAAAANRGVEAETGSNAIARTLFALVIASVLGAAAFVAGRRFLV